MVNIMDIMMLVKIGKIKTKLSRLIIISPGTLKK
jgi:hypothetical protein